MISLLTTLAAHWQAARARHAATCELAAMSACELGDMGVTRLDISRLFEPRVAPELCSRGGGGRIVPTAAFKPLLQRSAVMTTMESRA
jgi:uncharacterized protein YjiS (DUF1127 family)